MTCSSEILEGMVDGKTKRLMKSKSHIERQLQGMEGEHETHDYDEVVSCMVT